MSGPDCVWCGMTIDAHRESGVVAKTPCGMLKHGFVAATPEKQRSVGNVLAPRADAELVEKLATDRERARCAGIARKLLSMWRVDSQDLRDTVAAIENGAQP